MSFVYGVDLLLFKSKFYEDDAAQSLRSVFLFELRTFSVCTSDGLRDLRESVTLKELY